MVTRTKTLNSNGYLWPAGTQKSLLCDGLITDQIVDDFGVNVKIREVRKSEFNQYGDATKTYLDSYTKAYIHQWQATDDEVKEGIYKNGQIMFVFKPSDKAKIQTQNQVFYESEWYKIVEVSQQVFSGRTYLINAIVKKMQQ